MRVKLLQTVVGAEPDNELAWMWLANIAESAAEAATCLEKVLAINPDNDLARRYLRAVPIQRHQRPSSGTDE